MSIKRSYAQLSCVEITHTAQNYIEPEEHRGTLDKTISSVSVM